jgi:FHA domain-containing protein
MLDRFIILDGERPREVAPEGEVLEVGRAPRLGMVLEDPTVSRRHAVVRRRGRRLTIEDTGSTFGTFINDRALERGQATELRDGDVIRLGQVRVVCRLEAEDDPDDSSFESASFAAQANARVLVLEGEKVRRQPLAGVVTIIGGAPHCEVRLQDRLAPPEAALIRAVQGEYRIEPRSAAAALQLNESQARVLEPAALPTNSAFLLQKAQALFLYDFGRRGMPVRDPFASVPWRRIMASVEELCGVSARELRKLVRGRRPMGQSLGEVLVEHHLITPLFWRVVSTRIIESGGRRVGLLKRMGNSLAGWKAFRP